MTSCTIACAHADMDVSNHPDTGERLKAAMDRVEAGHQPVDTAQVGHIRRSGETALAPWEHCNWRAAE